MLAFNDISVKTKSESETSGSYEIAPLPKGYGHTIANPLRRILLSSLPGAGITSVRIKDVKHEYSTIEGITEDVITILLNLKNIRFKMLVEEPVTCKLSVSGAKIVKAKDIKLGTGIELMTPDVEIANLTSKSASLDMEIIVEKGVGYRKADEESRSEIGKLPMDADFTPVKKVNIDVSKARKGQETELDSVIIDIETDGSISPKDALMTSARILQDFAGNVMVALGMSKVEVEKMAEESATPVEVVEEVTETVNNEVMSWKVEDLPISKRSKTGLINGNLLSVEDISKLTLKELSKLPGFGAKSLNEVVSLLGQYGITLIEE